MVVNVIVLLILFFANCNGFTSQKGNKETDNMVCYDLIVFFRYHVLKKFKKKN